MDVEQSKINILIQEFELFCMNDDKTIFDMQKRFAYLVNRLRALGKLVSNEVSTNKVLRCLSRNWQPKVTTIKEANDLTTPNLSTLFGKLEENRQELVTLDKREKKIKKEKHIEKDKSKAPETTSTKSKGKEQDDGTSSDEDSYDSEDIKLFVQRYNKYIKRNGVEHSDKNLIELVIK
jgi:hypothetical protein